MRMKHLKILLLAPLLMAFQCDEDIGFEDDALIGTDLLGRWEIADESRDGISDLSVKCCRFFEFSLDGDPEDLTGRFLYEDGTGGFYEGIFTVDPDRQTILFQRENRDPVTYDYALNEPRDYLSFTYTDDDAQVEEGWKRIY